MAKPIVIRCGEDWEIVNDDGLIYKRRKKDRDAIAAAPQCLPQAPNPLTNPHWRRQRKKAALQQLKSRYIAEIEEWEAIIQKLEKPLEQPLHSTESLTPQKLAFQMPEDRIAVLVESLLCQVEELERFMDELKILCCDVEHMCKPPEENGEFYHQIGSPRLLVEALETTI